MLARRPRNFGIFYGYGPLDGLGQFDWLILEPAGWRPHDLAQLRQQGPLTLAYVSCLEVLPWVAEEAGLEPRDFLSVSGRLWEKPELSTRVADPRSPRWRAHLTRRFTRLREEGYHGVFLDTLGDIEDEAVRDQTGWLVPAAAELVVLARRSFPDGLVAMNNGLWLLLPVAAPYLDAVCWEAPLTAEILREPWAQAALDLVARHTVDGRMMGLLLSHISPGNPDALQAFRQLGSGLGLLTYAAPADYAEAVRLPDGTIRQGSRK
jgi:hypothetical protein